MNRFTEVSWMYNRLLPNLQIEAESLRQDWSCRWQVLDDSFWQMEMGLAGIKKKMAEVFIRFTNLKFPFYPTINRD